MGYPIGGGTDMTVAYNYDPFVPTLPEGNTQGLIWLPVYRSY